jgi:hypothetical protein
MGFASDYISLFLLFFLAPSASSEGLNFLVLGDFGGQSKAPYTTDIQIACATAMSTKTCPLTLHSPITSIICSSIIFLLLNFRAIRSDPIPNPLMKIGGLSQQEDSAFIVSVGDNMYDNGVENEYDPRFLYTFEEVYAAAPLKKRWYMQVGNRDYYGNASADVILQISC